MVSIDIYVNETTRHADVILPPPSPLEKRHYDAASTASRCAGSPTSRHRCSPPTAERERRAGATHAVVAGAGARRRPGPRPRGDPRRACSHHAVANPDSNVFGRDAGELRAMRAGREPEDRMVDAYVRTGPWGDAFGAVPCGRQPAGVARQPARHRLRPARAAAARATSNTPSAKVELAPPEIVDSLPSVLASVADVGRTAHDRPPPPAFEQQLDAQHRRAGEGQGAMHAADPSRRRRSSAGCATGDCAEVRSDSAGTVTALVEVSDEVMPGVVSIAARVGSRRRGRAAAVAERRPGVNIESPRRRWRARPAVRQRPDQRRAGRRGTR